VTLPAPFLLDTDTVVELHKLGLWNSIVRYYGKIFLAQTVYETEVRYYPSPTNPRIPINLEPLIKKGNVKILKGKIITVKKIEEFLNEFDVTERPVLQAGELESLAIIVDSDHLCFCTMDRAAIRALSMMELVNRGISFEELISNCRIRVKLKAKYKYTKKYFEEWITEGKFPLIHKPSGYFKKFMVKGKFGPIS